MYTCCKITAIIEGKGKTTWEQRTMNFRIDKFVEVAHD